MKKFFLFLLLFTAYLSAEDAYIDFSGHLGKEQYIEAKNKIAKSDNIILVVHSTSGDLVESLDFAKFLYEEKWKEKKHISLLIEDSAVGPSAILPFLADDLYVTPLVAWGDIPLGNEKVMTNNLLTSKVLGLIDTQNKESKTIVMLAKSMINPGLSLQDANDHAKTTIAPEKGTTLVINTQELQQLNLLKGTLLKSEFIKKFGLEKKQQEVVDETPSSASNALTKLKNKIIYKSEGDNLVGRIIIDDRVAGINQSTWLYVKAALDYYKEKKPIFVILELNTPGGEVFAAQTISDALKELDTQYNIPVVCFINNWAISAGAMLAYSCRFITTVKNGSMGAAEPVIASETGEVKTASEKINSALRSDFAGRASFFDRNPLIAEGMVDKEMIIVKRNGKIIKLSNEDEIIRTGLNPDILISNKGKLLTLNANEMIEFDVADLIVPAVSLPALSDKEKETSITSGNKYPLFHADFFDEIPNVQVDTYQMDLKTRFLAFLANPVVSSILLMGLMIGIYLELNSPGATLPGSIAAISLFLIILSSFAQNIGNFLELFLLVGGVALILVEFLLLPTAGLLGFAGLVSFLVGLLGLMLPGLDKVNFEWDQNRFNAAGENVLHLLGWFSFAILLSILLMILLSKYVLPKFGLFNRLVLQGNEQDREKGFTAIGLDSQYPAIGTEAIVEVTLRPAGKVKIQDTIYDALSEGDWIQKDESVIVTRIDSGQVVVKLKKVRL